MGTTVTSVLGYGLKINKEFFPADGVALQYSETFLNEDQYPALEIVYSGFAPYEEQWVFVKSTCTKLRSHSEAGMEAPVNNLKQITEEETLQLQRWSEEACQNATPSYQLIQYVN